MSLKHIKCGHLLQTQLYLFSKPNQMHIIYLKFILFWINTLHVSDGLYVHRQESNTVHTASGICHTGSMAAC
jgi:hypothetical protein